MSITGPGTRSLTTTQRSCPGSGAAKERGVIFDAANGRSHFSFAVARAAIADRFLPDVISSDLTVLTLYID